MEGGGVEWSERMEYDILCNEDSTTIINHAIQESI